METMFQLFLYSLSQVLSYGLWWGVFLSVIYGAARYAFWWCIPMAHIIVAIGVFLLDVRWIRAEMSRPDWNGSPDMDIVFAIGVAIRMILINTLLIPVTGLGWWQRKRDRQAKTAAASAT